MKRILLFSAVILFLTSKLFAGIWLTANPTSIPADNTSTSQVTAYAYGLQSGTFPVTLSFALSGEGTLIGANPVLSDMNGCAVITYRSSLVPGDATVTASCDQAGVSNPVTITSTELPNQAPTCSPSANPTSGKKPLTVQFNANASDTDGTVVSYSWTFGDGGTSTEQNPSYVYNTEGNYSVSLIVTDNDGATGTGNSSVAVVTNQAPTCAPSANPIEGKKPLTVQFSANASDTDGTVVSYAWTFGDNGTSSEANPATSIKAPVRIRLGAQ